MSRVGKILEFSCRQPALCTGAQHQSRWVHILQPPLSRGPLSAVLSSTRQPEEMHHSRTTAVFVCISRMYIVCMCHDSRRSGLHFQPWALFFFRPSFHLVRTTAYSVPLVLRELQARQLPHLVCWLPTRELLINSRPLLLLLLQLQLLHSFFLFLLRPSCPSSLSFLPLCG